MRVALFLGLILAGPALAQEMDHSHHISPAADPHAGHHPPPAPLPQATAPDAATNYAADRHFDPAAMAAARAALFREHGAMRYGQIMLDRAEIHGDGYAWSLEASTGGDIDRLMITSEGEGAERLNGAELQALWSHALDPYWNLHLGLRQDIRPRPGRSYAVIGVEGLAPWWIEVEASLFLSNKGDVSARIEAYHDMRLTQRLILQPRIEVAFAASDDRAAGSGSGLSDADIGLRLRYEISRQFAPYVGIDHERRFGNSARYAIAAGEDRRETRAVLGVRAWF